MRPLVLITGPTASGKSALALALALRFGGEILSCDSIAVYRGMDLGSAKPSAADRALVPHHLLDLYDPDQTCTAGDYARAGRAVLAQMASRSVLPIVSGGTGLYARALIEGLSSAPRRNLELRALLSARASGRGPAHLHRTLGRFDPAAAARIHPNDVPKTIRAIEVSVAGRAPITEQWAEHAPDPLPGYRVLRINLDPPRHELYMRINHRARQMFVDGLIEETRALIARFGLDHPPLASLGYRQAAAVVTGQLSEPAAIAEAQQGHRNYAKRQLTWFRRAAQLHPTHTLNLFGDHAEGLSAAIALLEPFGSSDK
jgi:tRNA dimethylallyltransferase